MGHAETHAPRTGRTPPDLDGRVLDAVHRRIAISSTTRRWSCAPKECTYGATRALRYSTGRRACSASMRATAAEEIADAVGAQLRELDFIAPFTRGHPKQFELATRVAELTPGDLNRIFFVNSGSEAVDTAMKVALAYHQARGQGGRNDVRLPRARVPRCQFRRHFAGRHGQQSAQVRTDAARYRAHAPHASSRKTSSSPAKAATASSWPRPGALRQPLRRREYRRLLRRADRRLDRLPGPAQGLSAAAAGHLRRARHSFSSSTR